MLAGLVLVPGSVWLELSPVRRPSIRWQVDSGGGGGAATGKLQTLHHKKLCRVMSSGFNGLKGLQREGLIALSLSLSLSQPGEQRSKELRQEGADIPPGTIEDWLEKRAKRLSAAQSNRYWWLGSICMRAGCCFWPTRCRGGNPQEGSEWDGRRHR